MLFSGLWDLESWKHHQQQDVLLDDQNSGLKNHPEVKFKQLGVLHLVIVTSIFAATSLFQLLLKYCPEDWVNLVSCLACG
jgi:hypothetical protein